MNNNYNNYNTGSNQNMNMNYVTYQKQDTANLAGYVGAIILALATLLEYCTYSGGAGYNYFIYSSSGPMILSLAIIAIILIYIKKNMVNVFPGIIGLVYSINDFMSIKETTAEVGLGVWFALIGSVILLISCYLYWKEHPEVLKGIIDVRPRYNGYQNIAPMTYGNNTTNNNTPSNEFVEEEKEEKVIEEEPVSDVPNAVKVETKPKRTRKTTSTKKEIK